MTKYLKGFKRQVFTLAHSFGLWSLGSMASSCDGEGESHVDEHMVDQSG